jgi:predicted adenine nucleotide alpha hydrolase (AANH) superfamily ATPase
MVGKMKNNRQRPVINYQQWLDKKINKIKKEKSVPELLLHSCCAPCSSYVLEYLSQYFTITVLFYNPNIHPEEEYNRRLNEQKRFIEHLSVKNKVRFIEGQYEPELFFQKIKGLEKEKEGGKRCIRCYELRLEKTAHKASELKVPYFTTTLTVSPHKNAGIINHIGHKIAKIYQLDYLYSDFKKKEGFKRSVILSDQYHLYRQDYCGCIFSKYNIVS